MQNTTIDIRNTRNLTHEQIREHEILSQSLALRDLEVSYPDLNSEMTREEINARIREQQELLDQDRFGRLTHLSERETTLQLRIQEEADNVQILNEQITNNAIIHQEIAETTNRIIERTAWYHQLDRYITIFHQSPFLFKLLLLGGTIITVTGTVIIGIKIIRKITNDFSLYSNSKVTTIISPFGPRKNLTIFGRVLDAIIFRK